MPLGVAGYQKHRRCIQVRQRSPELCELPFGILDLGRNLDPLGLNRGNDVGNGFAHPRNLGIPGYFCFHRLRHNIANIACAARPLRRPIMTPR
jgi:hypothetical protein